MKIDAGKGRHIRVVSPSGPCDPGKLEAGRSYLEDRGFSVTFGKSALKKRGYLAGTDQERLDDLAGALDDPEVDIIWFSRGGFGSVRLLHLLPRYHRRKEKTLIGYSDSTAVFCWASRSPKLWALYGPSFGEVSDSKAADGESLWAAIDWWPFSLKGKPSDPYEEEFTVTGGCLSVLSALAGTRYFPDLDGRFLFIEDVNEPMYRIDRMLTHLSLSGAFDRASGLILGSFAGMQDGTEKDVYLRAWELSGGKPVIRGIKSGHVDRKRTIPFDRPARWDGRILSFL
ncbi:MAG TPA: LD-carboxypeptidase [Acidobacteriota bacterium]|nr:LD-carboxypeptidase [Acidobacteriota bacterium]HNT16756.1 LD-carboxypeptidase [Acidobacteriota bacterium]